MTLASSRAPRWIFVLIAMARAEAAFAHVGHGTMESGGFLDGFSHPITGIDHLVAMVAVGLWGAQLRAPAIWLLPITFPLVMAVGGFLGVIGVPLPGVDVGVALSGVVLGALVATAARTPLWIADVVVGAFGLLHGHAHGAAMPLSGSPIAFGAGFVVATGLLHLTGILIGLLVRWPAGAVAVRAGGAAIALAAAYSLIILVADAG
jgi:urease accessory protein